MEPRNYRNWLFAIPGALMLSVVSPLHAQTLDLKSAVEAALESHPEINQAIQNKEAIEFERKQAQGQFLPRFTVEGSAGVRRLENATRRSLGIANQTLYPVEVDLIGQQTLLDFGARGAELRRQAARTDGAALRVEERSEFVALNVTRQYLDYLLQQRIVAASEDNISFHQKLVNDLNEGVSRGSISIADLQQAEERLQAAKVRKTEAEQDLASAAISFRTLTGLSIADVTMPETVAAALPPTLDDALALARDKNPKVREAQADVDAAYAVVDAAKADLRPTLSLETQNRVGQDIDGFRGSTNDVLARVVLRWNLFDGGINRAKVQEMTRRASEARFRLSQYERESEEDVRNAWTRWDTEKKLSTDLQQQSKVSDDLLVSYREQFNVGRRSLLDVLDTQNSRYNVQVRVETSRFAQVYAEYQVLAATNTLLSTLGVSPSAASKPYARARFDVPDTPPAETMRRRYPN